MIFAGPLERVRYRARIATRRIVFGAIGGLFVLTGLVFMAVALWITLADLYGTRATAIIAGVTCIGLGILVLAFSYRHPRMIRTDAEGRMANVATPAPATLTAATLLNAFVVGLRAGRYRRPSRRRD